MSLPDTRRFAGVRFGLSISIAPDLPVNTEPEQFINALTFRIGSNILLEGGGLVMGQHWRTDGIMESLAFQARDSRNFRLPPSVNPSTKPPAPLLNLLAWPDTPPSGDKNAERMIRDGALEIRTVLPPDIPLAQLEADPVKALTTSPGKFARVRALTAMRKELVRWCDARICLGGDTGKSHRRLPGLIEEAMLTCQAGKPVWIASALGGASKAMADAILHRRMSDDARAMFFTPASVVDLFTELTPQYPVKVEEGPSSESGWNALAFFQSLSLSTLSEQAGLSEEEYLIVLTSTDVQRVIALAMTGILRKRTTGPATSA